MKRTTRPGPRPPAPHPDEADVVEGAGFRMERHGRFIHTRVDRTDAEHRALITHLAGSVEDQQAALARQVAEVEGRLASVDSFTMLGALSLQNHLADPETYEETSFRGKSFVAEYATLLALKQPYATDAAPYADGATLGALQEAVEGVLQSTTLLQTMRDARRMLARADASGAAAPVPDAALDVQRTMRGHELTVRNMAYEHHHHEVLRGLFGPFASALGDAVGFDVDDALRLSRAVVDRLQEQVRARLEAAAAQRAATEREVDRARRKHTRAAFRAELARETDDAARAHGEFVLQLARRPADEVREFLGYTSVEWTLLTAADLCTFTPQQLADVAGVPVGRAEAFARAFTLEFGSVPADFVEPSPTHPLRTRPLVHHGGRYMGPAPMLLDWAIQPAFEAALKAAGTGAWHRYERHRHDYLLGAAVAQFRRMMPRSTFDTNLLYDVGGARAREAELDALGRYDDLTFVVEAKGMSVTDPARRGAPDRLRRDLSQLVGESHAQAARAKRHLEDARDSAGAARFRRAAGGPDVVVPADAVREVRLISVTLAPIGHITAELPADTETGLFQGGEYSWVVTLYDLMVIADLVDSPVTFPHFLSRRVHAAHLGVLEAGDELDLFMYYLKEGLYLDDVPEQMRAEAEAEGGRPGFVRLLSFTGPVDAYYAHATGRRTTPAPKPTQDVPEALRALLARLEASALPGWLEASLALLDLDAAARAQVARLAEQARKVARSRGHPSNGSVASRDSGGWGLSYWCAAGPHATTIARDVEAYCERKRREFGLARWVGIGEDVSDRHGRRVVRVVHLRPADDPATSSRPHQTVVTRPSA